jgi:hypothetical protein
MADEHAIGAVVAMVSVADAVPVPLIVTGLVVPKLAVGGYKAFAGLEVIAAVSVTLPVNPPEGVIVIAEVFPVVAPAAAVTAVPLTAYPEAVRPIADEVLAAYWLSPA